MESKSTQVRRVLEGRLLTRAMEDPAFHKQLMTDPRAAFELEMGIPFPAAGKLQVIEESADTLLLVVPTATAPGGELSDAQLAAVAGGSLWTDLTDALGLGKFKQSAATLNTGVAGVRA
jgi:hypothetical protein